ncbi:hypothetical protein BH20VER2_BH20VER2_15470 [soil metagenome]|nr:hypothetical protein [Chthoniobacterales bacterium]
MSIIKPVLVAVVAICFAFTGNAFAREAKTSSKSKSSNSSASSKKKSSTSKKSSRPKQKSAKPSKPRATWINASSLHFDGFAEEFPEEDLPEPEAAE